MEERREENGGSRSGGWEVANENNQHIPVNLSKILSL